MQEEKIEAQDRRIEKQKERIDAQDDKIDAQGRQIRVLEQTIQLLRQQVAGSSSAAASLVRCLSVVPVSLMDTDELRWLAEYGSCSAAPGT